MHPECQALSGFSKGFVRCAGKGRPSYNVIIDIWEPSQKDAVTPSEVREWAQVAEAILINLEMASAPAKDIDVLRQPLLDALDKAITRRREKRTQREGAEGT